MPPESPTPPPGAARARPWAVPLKIETTIWGWYRRMTRTTSLRIVSFGQCFQVSSCDFEKPKSYALVKNCPAPSRRRAASNSSVRSSPRARPNSGPIRFWPPSPRLSERYAASAPIPRSSTVSSSVSSSSGCAPMTSTRFTCPSIRSSRSRATRPPVDGGSSCARSGEQRIRVASSPADATKEKRRRTGSGRGE